MHVSLLLLAALGLAGTLGFLLWAVLGRPGLSPASPLDSKDRLDAVKLILAAVGGVGAVVALTIAYRRQRRGENAERDEYIKLFTDRFGVAAEQLGHESPATRMAGVFAMSRLADDVDDEDTDGRQQCINVLCSYLRLPYEPQRGMPNYREGERVVRQTVLRVIRDHLRPGFSPVMWWGHNFSLAGAVFDEGDLTGIRVTSGHLTFHGARFVSGDFYFSGASIEGGHVWFTEAKFDGATVKFENTKFLAGIVSFDGADFTGGIVSFKGAQDPDRIVEFQNARFNGASIEWDQLAPPPPSP